MPLTDHGRDVFAEEYDKAYRAVVATIAAADDLSKHLRAWVLSGLSYDDWPTVQAAGVRYEKARAALSPADAAIVEALKP